MRRVTWVRIIGRELGDEFRLAQAAMRFGETYWRLRQNDKAASCTMTALKILLDLKADPNVVATCYHILGTINQNRGDLDESEKQLRRALDLRRERARARRGARRNAARRSHTNEPGNDFGFSRSP